MVGKIPVLLMLLLMPCLASAALLLDRTRVVFSSADKEVVVVVHNDGDAPGLLKTWIGRTAHDSVAEAEDVPLLALPPLARLDAGKQQAIRILSTGQPLPDDRESLFWLHVLEVPRRPEADDGSIQLAVQTTLKLLARPAGLGTPGETAARNLQWRVSRAANGADGDVCQLVIDNPGPFHVSLTNIELGSGAQRLTLAEPATLVAPFSTFRAALNGCPRSEAPLPSIAYTFIDDQGNAHTRSAKLRPADTADAGSASSIPTGSPQP